MHRPGNRIGSGLRLATRSQLTDAPPPLAPALDAATAGWHTAFAQRLSGPLDLPVLRSAISAVAARQDLLRYRIVDGRGVVDRPDEVPLTVVDLTDLPGAQRAAVLDTHLATLARMAFDPTDGLCRFAVYRLDPTDHVVAFAGHRAVFDDRTRALLSADLAAAYATGGAPLPPLGATFADYLAWRGARSRWRSTQLDPAPARLELPADAPRLGAPGIHSGYATSTLDTTTSACVGDLARSLDTTAPAVLLAALGVVLARLSGHGEVGLGTPLDGPRPPAFARLIGSCVEVAALRLRPDAGTSFIDQVRRARDELSVASAPAGLGEVATAGVARLAAMPRPGRAGSPVQVLFEPVTAGPALDLAGLTSQPVPVPVPTPVEVTVRCVPDGDRLRLDVAYDAGRYRAERIRALLATLVHVVRQAVTAPDGPVGELALRPDDQPAPEGNEAVLDPLGRRAAVGELGEIAVHWPGGWLGTGRTGRYRPDGTVEPARPVGTADPASPAGITGTAGITATAGTTEPAAAEAAAAEAAEPAA